MNNKRFLTKLRRLAPIFFLCFPLLFQIQPTFSAPVFNVTSRTPAINQLNVPVDSDISVTFGSDIDSTTVNSNTFNVGGSLSGIIAGSYNTVGDTIEFDPANDFQCGETITVTLTTAIHSLFSVSLNIATTWQFSVEVTGGAGMFPVGVNLEMSSPLTYGVTLGDVDNDGDLDIVTNQIWTKKVVYINDGTGTMSPDYASGEIFEYSYAFALGDIDGDGDLDIVTGFESYPNVILMNDGTGVSWTPITFDTSCKQVRGVALGDLDGDGDIDIVLGNAASQDKVFINDGTGTAWTPINFGPINSLTLSVALGDLDKDGDLDIVKGNYGQSAVYLNNGIGTGWTPFNYGSGTDYTWALALGDIDDDGDLDIVTGGESVQNVIYANDGTGTGWTGINFGTGTDYTYSLALGDMDDDGDLDIVTVNNDEQNVVYINDGTGINWGTTNFGTGVDSTKAVAVGDLDGDGGLDIVVGNRLSDDFIYFNGIQLTVSGITANDKTYDGNTVATLNTGSAALVGVQGDDDVSLVTTSATGAFEDKNVANGLTVTVSGLTLGGADATNYTLTQPSTTADITGRLITVKADSQEKLFLGADPAFTYTITSGSLLNGDSFSGSLTREFGELPGRYDIRLGSLTAGDNYIINYRNAYLTIRMPDAPAQPTGTDPVVTITPTTTPTPTTTTTTTPATTTTTATTTTPATQGTTVINMTNPGQAPTTDQSPSQVLITTPGTITTIPPGTPGSQNSNSWPLIIITGLGFIIGLGVIFYFGGRR